MNPRTALATLKAAIEVAIAAKDLYDRLNERI